MHHISINNSILTTAYTSNQNFSTKQIEKTHLLEIILEVKPSIILVYSSFYYTNNVVKV